MQNCKKTLKKAKRNGRTEFVGGLQERKPDAEVLKTIDRKQRPALRMTWSWIVKIPHTQGYVACNTNRS